MYNTVYTNLQHLLNQIQCFIFVYNPRHPETFALVDLLVLALFEFKGDTDITFVIAELSTPEQVALSSMDKYNFNSAMFRSSLICKMYIKPSFPPTHTEYQYYYHHCYILIVLIVIVLIIVIIII